MRNYLLFSFLTFIVSCATDLKDSTSKPTLFESVKAEDSGIQFNNLISEDANNFFMVYNYAYNGGGVATGDINNDGLTDLYFTGNQVSNKLYLNQGNFEFRDITEDAEVSGEKGWSNGVVMTDVNGDGFLDIYVCKGGWKGSLKERANLLYINNGDSTFTESAQELGLADEGFSMMASFFDMDNDNDLDMYLINRPQKFNGTHSSVRKGKADENPLYRHKLYENVDGHFIDVALNSGIKETYSFGLGLATSDLDKDGLVDIYVANDYFESDYYFKNKGSKQFNQEISSFSNHVAFYGMGVDVVDFNNDGFEDLIELDMTPSDHERSKINMASMDVKAYNRILAEGNHYQYMHNMLQINNGNGFFSEVSQFAGVAKTDWSWSCLGADFDNDGFRDLFISNGFRRDVFDKDVSQEFKTYTSSSEKKNRSKEDNLKHIVNMYKENKIPNHVYRNKGNLKFESKIKEWGLETVSFSNGASVADLDNDGDLDLIVNNINDKAFVYKNNSEKNGNNYLKIKLNGPQKNRKGLGAKITIYHKDSIQYHELKNVRGYLSSVESIAHFGLGKISKIDYVEVLWPDSKQNILYSLDANQLVGIDYSKAIKVHRIPHKSKETVFVDITEKAFNGVDISHKENTYDDFRDQILLPHKLSTEGPCISVADVNNDGYEDFFIGGSHSFPGRIFLQTKNKTFVASVQNSIAKDKGYEDVDAVFFDANSDGFQDLYVVSGGSEFQNGSRAYQDRLYLNDGNGKFKSSSILPKINSSGGCVLPLDYDADGDLDLFVGGRLVPKKYPKAPKSYLLENRNGVFVDVIDAVAPSLEYIGLVTDAAFEDINSNGVKELIVVGEWMPITVFEVKKNSFEKSEELGIEKSHGWWNCITASDIDADGDMDFVVGNLGKNYKFKASQEKPFYVFASDYDNNGTNDVFLAKNYKNKIVPVRGKECSTQQLPGLDQKFKSYEQFAKADINDVLGASEKSSVKHKAYEFNSVVLRNNKGVLTMENLPYQAQFSTVQSVLVDDFTNDGLKDVLIAGNRFNVEVETTRADASVGLFLQSDAHGNYIPSSAIESGVFLKNNTKELKTILLGNRSKKTSKGILVGVNNNSTRLLKASSQN
ncbi:VCBS repeat-containing protein [Flavicella sp.]|uniref:VCBS repeat-containing protein n=1 Tax=Flavicella sp. TaxID=2957742 RepID=UPI002630DD87|nr:VCBS repeat-containing protein [Flavicella sp.]MDG1805845.1 VCBS repeat-containing protein [Flavicella sp.]MDG2279429.1 VCBS repeat-containing protein [Flavicella sp.]